MRLTFPELRVGLPVMPCQRRGLDLDSCAGRVRGELTQYGMDAVEQAWQVVPGSLPTARPCGPAPESVFCPQRHRKVGKPLFQKLPRAAADDVQFDAGTMAQVIEQFHRRGVGQSQFRRVRNGDDRSVVIEQHVHAGCFRCTLDNQRQPILRARR